MNTLRWVLAGILLYWLVMAVLNRRGLLPTSIHLNGPITTIHTEWGKVTLDRLAQARRFWRAWANVGLGAALMVMVGAFLFLFTSALSILQNPPESQVSQPQNVLVIPGVNDFLPLSVAPEIIAGLVVGLIVHEGGHGLLCRVEDIDIESLGLALLAFIPLGAFVQPDEDSQEAADRGARTRMFAAGVTNNFAITVIAFLLLFGPVAGSIGVAAGAAVGDALPGSAAADAGIDRGDRITAVGNTTISSNDQLEQYLRNDSSETISVELNDDRTTTVHRSVLVSRAVADGPTGIEVSDVITAVNGTPVNTTAGLYETIGDREQVTVSLQDNTSQRIAVGSLVTVRDGALQDGTALERGDMAVVVSLADQRTVTTADLQAVLANTSAGDTINVTYYVDSERYTGTVTLGGAGTPGVLGVQAISGLSGLQFDDLGVQYYPAGAYLSLLGGDPPTDPNLNPAITDTFIGKTLFTLFLPVASVVSNVLPYNFPGFTGEFTSFYVAEGSLAFLGSGIFLLANLLFWIGWININLGFFNCVPAFPLDGGHILRTSTEAVVSRLPIEGSYQLTKAITITIGLTMFVSFGLVVFGPELLG